MSHGLSGETVDRIRGVLAQFPEVEKAVLYGSRAKGDYKRGSDIDLALIGNDLNASVLSKINNALDDLPLPYKIDPSILRKISHTDLLDHIRRVGAIFYEKQAETVQR